MVDVKFSYLSNDLSVDSPPVLIMNVRQFQNFVGHFKRKITIRLCVTFKPRVDDRRIIYTLVYTSLCFSFLYKVYIHLLYKVDDRRIFSQMYFKLS